MTTEQFVLELAKILVPSTVALIGVVYAAKAATRAQTAVNKSAEAIDKTQENKVVMTELGARLDGRLEELKKLWQSEAHLQGRMDERTESEVRALAVRAEAKADRAEGAAASLPVQSQEVIPVETRTEANEKEKEK